MKAGVGAATKAPLITTSKTLQAKAVKGMIYKLDFGSNRGPPRIILGEAGAPRAVLGAIYV